MDEKDPDNNKRGHVFRTVSSLFAIIAIVCGLFLSQFAGPAYSMVGVSLLGVGVIIFLYLTFGTNN